MPAPPISLNIMAVDVSTPVFEGPFDLLLHLILKEQVDIYEVSLSVIVDAYLAELAAMQSLDLEVATEFLLIAATLVELKARRLCPGARTSISTRNWLSGKSATCCSRGCSSARHSRTCRASSSNLPILQIGPSPGPPGPTNAFPN